MSMRHFSVYRLSDGLFTGQQIGLPTVATEREQSHALGTLPEGCAVMEGRFDHLAQRVDLTTCAVVDYQPPQPSPDHEWDEATKRWQLSAAAVERQQRRSEAVARIRELEAAQARPLRELALRPGDPTALGRLREIEAEIAFHRGFAK